MTASSATDCARPASASRCRESNLYGTEALTILRGPASGLYGLGSPGGIVDVTSKRPVFAQFGEVWFQGGNFDRYQGNFDIGAPVEGSDGTMAFRLTGVARQSDTFLPGPGVRDDRFTIAPAFTWRPTADTTFTLLTEFQESNVPGNASFYNFPGFRVSRIYSGDGALNTYRTDQHRIGYAFEHRFSPDLILRQNFRYSGVDANFSYTQVDGVTGLSAQRSTGLFKQSLASFAVDTQLEGHLYTGPVAHTLLAGIDYYHYDFSSVAGFGVAPDLNLLTLNYGRQPIARPSIDRAPRGAERRIRSASISRNRRGVGEVRPDADRARRTGSPPTRRRRDPGRGRRSAGARTTAPSPTGRA
ncbi:hypothetical protein ACU4GA_09580 [Methylobacterium oryzae CBMB20]